MKINNSKDLILDVKIQPNAKKNEIAGKMADGVLKIKIKAPAVDNKANEELVFFLSKKCGIPQKNITIISGITSSRKKLKILGQVCLEDFLKD